MQAKREAVSNRIRQSEENRRAERRQQKQLRQEYLEEVGKSRRSKGNVEYLPNILVGLLFLSFPLGQEEIDWVVVGLTLIANIIPLLLLSNPSSWVNIFQISLINIVVLQYSTYIYHFPTMVRSVSPFYVISYVLLNTIFSFVLYIFYVKTKNSKQLLKKGKSSSSVDDEIRQFKEDIEKASRVDNACCVVLLVNFAAFVALGVVPYEVVLKVFVALRRLLI